MIYEDILTPFVSQEDDEYSADEEEYETPEEGDSEELE